MDSSIVQELIDARAEKLLDLSPDDITKHVRDCIRMISPEALDHLLGLDSRNDGLTQPLWNQAVSTAEMTSDLVFPGWDGESSSPKPCSFELAINIVAGRVARAILTVNGLVKGTMGDGAFVHIPKQS